jgi:predicted nucleic acid-binding protein
VILADTSVWIDHFRAGDARLEAELNRDNVLMHAFVAGELALGSLNQRKKVLADLDMLPVVKIARASEVRELIERRSLYSRGLGYIDAHLIASVLLTPGTALWTRDKRLRMATESLRIHVQFT